MYQPDKASPVPAAVDVQGALALAVQTIDRGEAGLTVVVLAGVDPTSVRLGLLVADGLGRSHRIVAAELFGTDGADLVRVTLRDTDLRVIGR